MTVESVFVFIGLVLLVARVLAGCGATQQAREAAAEASYSAELQACVHKYETALEMDACADGVRMRWGVMTTTRKDGGR